MPNGSQYPDEIEIVHLGRDQEPADDQGWILVENTVSGPVIRKTVGEGGAAVGGNQGPFAAAEDAFESAIRQARKRGIPVVYAKGFSHA
jgi:hypothetical protein